MGTQDMNIKIPDDVSRIMEALNAHGYEAHIVGGCVRDALRGETPRDWDITTNAAPDEMKDVFCRYKIIPTGERYGTMTVLLNGNPYEITTYRADGSYGDGRRPDSVAFSDTLEEDLQRRDFTVNAMAYNDVLGLTDCFGGVADLQGRVIRWVGNPETRFDEDALRIMRAVRFAVTLDFSIEKETAAAIFSRGGNLKNVSAERKRDELVKILTNIRGLNRDAPHYHTLREMTAYLIKRVMPETAASAHAFAQTTEMLFAADTDDMVLLLAVLLRETEHIEEVMRRLRFDGKTVENVLTLSAMRGLDMRSDRAQAKKLLRRFGYELCLKACQIRQMIAPDGGASEIRDLLRDIVEKNEPFTLADLAVNGHDLTAIGVAQGKEVGEALERCLEYVIKNPDKNNRRDLLAILGT